MIDLTITQSVNGEPFDGSLEQAIVEGIRQNLEERVGHMKCPIHGEPPKLRMEGADLDNLNMVIAGCCDDFNKSVASQMKDPD